MTITSRNNVSALILVVGSLIVGALIYILFRTSSLLVFSWVDLLGLSNLVANARHIVAPLLKYLPKLVLFSLPDGIWVFSFTVAIFFIWHDSKSKRGMYFWVILPLLLSISGEIGQFLQLVEGTYCNVDVVTCLISWLIAISLSPFYFKGLNYEA